jgi:acyl-CoA synthetase (AMP-forming)/AMP-acid ligase II
MTAIPQRLLGEALLISTKKNPSKTAIIIREKEFSYSMLQAAAQNIAAHLINSGIKKGDRVAIYMNNSWESIVSIYGITLSGGVFLFINAQTKANKLQYILNDCGAKILIAESLLHADISEALETATTVEQVIVSGNTTRVISPANVEVADFDSILLNGNSNVIFPAIIANDLAALIYTSGSTGFPKGVMMTHQAMVFTSWSLIEYLRLNADERIMLLLPLAFDYGLYQLLMTITVGGTLIVEKGFVFPASVYKQIEKTQPTVLPAVPTIFAMMIASNKETGLTFDFVKKITNTAAALPAEFIPDLKKIFPNALIFKMYGLTECKRVCYLEPELIDLKPTSVGKAIPGTELFLLSDDGHAVPANEAGILHIRGPHVMAGYWNKKELTDEMLKPGKINGERILCSNDLFKMDEEGFLYFQGRTDDIIKTRGEKVSPIEIENIIYKINGVKEVAVIGLTDAVMGQSVAAYITCHANTALSEKEVQKECMAHLEQFMVPQKIIFLQEMPKSSNGKIDKKELKNI